MKKIKKLVAQVINLGFDLFQDPVSYFWFNRQWGVASGERVTLTSLGWYISHLHMLPFLCQKLFTSNISDILYAIMRHMSSFRLRWWPGRYEVPCSIITKMRGGVIFCDGFSTILSDHSNWSLKSRSSFLPSLFIMN